jgi:hypothetical protein
MQVPSVLRKSSIYAATLIKNKIKFLICKEIQNGAVAKSYDSYMTYGLLIYGENLRISSYIRKAFLIKDFATAPL